MTPPQPFSDFLLFLRTRGFDVGLAQFQDLARLCESLSDELALDRQLLSRSIAGLLARSQEERDDIEKLFFVYYAEAFVRDPEVRLSQADAVQKGVFRDEVVKLQQKPPTRWKRRLALLLLPLLICGFAVLGYRKWFPKLPPAQEHKQEKPPDKEPEKGQGPSPPGSAPELPLPDLGPPLHLFHFEDAAKYVVPVPVLLFVGLFVFFRRRGLRGWAKKYWRAIRNDLGGGQLADIPFGKLLGPALDRGDLEDMATILGRSDDRPSSRALDGEKTVQETVKRGALPQLVYLRRSAARTILLLCDVSSDMRLWRRKTEALVDGLRRRGVPLLVRYFDGDAEYVSDQPFGRPESLAQVMRLYPDAGLLVVSAGVGIYDRDQPGKRADWLSLCERYRLRIWLHPVLSRSVWRKPLRRRDFPLRVLPMSRKGLLAAAYDLAQEKERRRHIAKADAATERSATDEDKQRLLQLLSLWPDAPLDLADYLRQKFCPQVPEEALLHVLAQSQDLSGQRLRFSEAELAQHFAQLQKQDAHLQTAAEVAQRLEERVRRDFLAVLHKHEPTDKSGIEHMQWRLRCAMQKLYLHDAEDRSANEAVAALRELAAGPLWEDVADALDPLGVPLHPQPRGRASRPLSTPVQEKLQKEVLGLIQQTAGGKVQIPRERKEVTTAGVGRPSALALAVRLLFPTLVLGSLIALGVWKKGIGQETREHVEAYRIETNPLESTESTQATLDISAQKPDAPRQVTLCENEKCQSDIYFTVTLNGERLRHFVKRQKEDRRYHVRARLANGVWGYSKQVLVAGYTPPPVGELLVHFVSEGKSVEKATFAVTDATGKAVQAESDKRLALRSGPVRIVGEVKPYAPFEKAAEVKKDTLETVTIDLGKLPPPPGMVEIPAGSFLMGSNDGDADEKPVHRVTLPTYYFDQYEVTMDDYQKCVRAGRCSSLEKTVKYEGYSEEDVKKWSPFCNVNQRGKGRHPVNCVDWSQAAAYCKWAGKRLPTEEEWEYAARGTDGRKYPWGNEAPRAGLLNACGSECIEMSKTKGFDGWKSMYSGNDGWEMTAPVGSVKGDKSPFGVMDLGGNVTEWVQDWYRDSYQKSDGPTKKRSLRGASWRHGNPSVARAPNRFGDSPEFRGFLVGFRCARTK